MIEIIQGTLYLMLAICIIVSLFALIVLFGLWIERRYNDLQFWWYLYQLKKRNKNDNN